MIKRYGIRGSIKLIISTIYTRLAFPQARIIRLPFDIRNRKYISIGKKFTTGFNCRIEAFPEDDKKCLHIGENVQINDYVHIAAVENIFIGDNVLIASKVFITDISHGCYDNLGVPDSPLVAPNDRKLVQNQ
ncbi:MAG: hypothetical protein JKY70_15035 [Mucilaginibacter sp.]|nr:hypothetical protein [Mucilaginibacter sp.]